LPDQRMKINQMREAVARYTGERYCAYCNKHRPLEGGKFRANTSNCKWMCKSCIDIRKGDKRGRN